MAGNCVTKILFETPLPGGRKFVEGTFLCTANTVSGMELDLTNSFSNSGSVTVVCSSANGHSLEHNKGTAGEGLVYIRRVDGAGLGNAPIAAEDWSAINIAFFATGQAK